MKIKIGVSSFLVLSFLMTTNSAFATLKVVSDKPVEPEFVCKTESDIQIARTIAIKRGGGPDFAGSSETLCRSQIEANKVKTTVIYQTAPTVNTQSETSLRLLKESTCRSVLLGGDLNTEGKCVCPTGKSPTTMPNQKDTFICLNSVKPTATSSVAYDSDRLKLSVNAMVDDFLKEKPEYSQIVDKDLITQLVLANPEKYLSQTMDQIFTMVYGRTPTGTSSTTQATTTPSVKLSKSLKIGSRGADVLVLQSLLGVEQTGYFGPKTREAVIKFQKSKNLPQTGFVGDMTRKELNK